MAHRLENPAIIPAGVLPTVRARPKSRNRHKAVTIHRGNGNTPYLRHRRKLRRLVC